MSNYTYLKKKNPHLIMWKTLRYMDSDCIDRISKDPSLVNGPVILMGSLAGYTLLHVACLRGDQQLVRLLVEDYKVDVNVAAKDGTLPIHLACFIFKNDLEDIVNVLLAANADVNAEFGQNIHSLYVKDSDWCSDFGAKMTILAYAVLNKSEHLIEILIRYGANTKIKSVTNKTLLMYILEDPFLSLGKFIAQLCEDKESINARDNDGLSIIHYLLHPKIFENFRFNPFTDCIKSNALYELIQFGADIDATINGDPNTLLLNTAAYRHCPNMLRVLLIHSKSITKSKALYYVTLRLRDSENLIRTSTRDNSTVLILKDLVNRRTFGLAVSEEEIKLMDKLIEMYAEIKKIVQIYERDFIQGVLNENVILFDDTCITFYELLKMNNLQLKRTIRRGNFLDAYHRASDKIICSDYEFFSDLLKRRIKRAELLNKLSQIEGLMKAIPLPYEIILEIIGYLNDTDFENFTTAFEKR